MSLENRRAGPDQAEILVLRELARALIAAAEHVPLGAAFVFDRELRFVDLGGPALRRFGWDPASLRGRLIVDTLPSWYYEQVVGNYEEALAGRQTRAFTRSIDGSSVFESDFIPTQLGSEVIGGAVISKALPASAAHSDRLTAREREVLRRAARGETTARIAEALFLAPTTVETHFRNGAAKLGARSRTHAVALALHLGEIDFREEGGDLPEVGPVSALASAPLPFVILERDGRIVSVNAAAERAFGWSVGELRGRGAIELIHDADVALLQQEMETSDLPGSTVADIAVRIALKVGGWVWTTWTIGGSTDGQTLVATGRTIRSLGALGLRFGRSPDGILRSIVEQAGVAIYVKDAAGRYLYANAYAEQVLGLAVGHLEGRSDDDVFAEAAATAVRAADERVLGQGERVVLREVVQRNGRDYAFLSIKFPIHDERGEISGLVGVSFGIDESADV